MQKLEKNGVIEPSISAWLNPVVLTRKKNGNLRFCVDFRRLNDLVDLDSFELPRINELFITLRDMKYFSLIDLKDGYFQVEINKSDREKTAFFTGNKLMQFKKMPQGFKNSPAVFQRVMSHILKDYIGKICLCYIDDILIFGKTKCEHEKNFKKIKERLDEYELEEISKKEYFA